MTVRVGVLGNSFAQLVQLPALRWAADNGAQNEVVVLAGHGLEKAQATAAEWSIPHATNRWQDAFDADKIGGPLDLVLISTPVDLHAPMVRAALEAKTAILCEKPFAMDGDEARALRDEAHGHFALLDHQTRWSPWRRAFAARVRDGICGTPWAARLQMRMGALGRIDRPYSWWYDEQRGGGVLGALGSHVIDGVLDQFGERIARVSSALLTFVDERPGPDSAPVRVTADETANLWCELESGLPLQIETGVLDFGCERDAGEGVLIELKGSRGTLRLEGETNLLFIPHGEPAQSIEVDPLPTNDELGLSIGGMFPRCLPGFLRDVIVAVQEGRRSLPGAATFNDAVHVMDVIDAARTSWRERRWIDVRRPGDSEGPGQT